MVKHKAKLALIGLAYLSFVSLGLPDGLVGVAWPSIRTFFNLPLDALGALLLMFTAGYLISSFNSGRVLARINVGSLLALSCLGTAISLLGYALAPRWWVMIALGTLAGLGAGAIDAGLNTYAATHFSARMVNWLHASYGIGAFTGPIIMTSVLAASHPWQWGYGIVGIWQLVLAACFGATYRLWPRARTRQATPESTSAAAPSIASTLRLPPVWLSIAVFFLYTGVEAAAGTWAYSLFTEGRGIPMMTAGMWVSVYWGGFTAGRLVSGVLAGFAPLHRFLRLCIIGIAFGAALLWLNITATFSFLGLALMGMSAAPIFPSLIASTPARLGKAHTANGVGFQIAAAVLGQSLLPAVVGVLASTLGLESVGPTLLSAVILLLVLYEGLTAISHRIAPEAVAA